jgi:hypothetical protein
MMNRFSLVHHIIYIEQKGSSNTKTSMVQALKKLRK